MRFSVAGPRGHRRMSSSTRSAAVAGRVPCGPAVESGHRACSRRGLSTVKSRLTIDLGKVLLNGPNGAKHRGSRMPAGGGASTHQPVLTTPSRCWAEGRNGRAQTLIVVRTSDEERPWRCHEEGSTGAAAQPGPELGCANHPYGSAGHCPSTTGSASGLRCRPDHASARPSRIANRASSTRSWISSLRIKLMVCRCAVSGLMRATLAISLRDSPLAT